MRPLLVVLFAGGSKRAPQDKSKEKLRDKAQEEEKLRQQFQKRLRHVLEAWVEWESFARGSGRTAAEVFGASLPVAVHRS